MLVLWQDGAHTIQAIADRLRLPPNALPPLLDRLEDAELIERRRDGVDRRLIHIALTKQGATLEKAASLAQQPVVCQTELPPDALDPMRDELKSLVERKEADTAALVSNEQDERLDETG